MFLLKRYLRQIILFFIIELLLIYCSLFFNIFNMYVYTYNFIFLYYLILVNFSLIFVNEYAIVIKFSRVKLCNNFIFSIIKKF